MIATVFRRVRSRTRVLPAFLPFAAVVGFLFATNVFMDAQTLTADQEAAAELGDAAAQVSLFDVELPVGTTTGDTLRDLARSSNSHVDMAISAIEFPYYAGGARGIFYRERDWKVSSAKAQYRLVDGRWPSEPGEVAIVGEREQVAQVGDKVATLGGGNPLRVVGIGQPRWEGSPVMLAAPGTWAALDAVPKERASLVGFPMFELADGRPGDLVEAVLQAVASAGVAPIADSVAGEWARAVEEKVRTRADSSAEAAPLWSEHSPLSLRMPGLILVPTTVLIGYLVLMRRFAVAARRMVVQGVRRRDAVTGLWLVPVPTILGLSAFAATLGTCVGWALAKRGVDRWGYHVANWRVPEAASGLWGVGCLFSVLLVWFAIRARALGPRLFRPSPTADGGRRLTPWRQFVAGVGACVCLRLALTMDSGSDGVVLTGSAVFTAALLSPELVRAMVRVMPERTLSQRLVSRQAAHHQSRLAVAATAYITLVAVAVGFLIVLASHTRDLRTRHPSAPPAGQILIDNNGATFLAVKPGVRAALATVPALQSREPVQFFLIGTRYLSKAGIEEVRGGIGTKDFPAVSFAFTSVDDVQVAYGRKLTEAERATLTGGGVLVPHPDQVAIHDGQVTLVDLTTRKSIAQVDALAAEPEPTPWADVPAVMLVKTVTALGLPYQPAAVVFNEVSDADADAAEQALIASGYSPRTMNKHQRPPAVLPPAAMIGSAVSLLLLALIISVLVSRAQVQDMRSWAAHLTRIGVRRQWTSRSLISQYLWVMGFSLPVGVLVTLIPLGFTHVRFPQLDLVIPWQQVAATLAIIVIATLAGAALAAKNLKSFEEREA